MVIKIDARKLSFMLLICYPLADILYNIFTKAESYSTFSILYMGVCLGLLVCARGYVLTKNIVYIALLFMVYLLFFFTKSGSVLIQFFLFLIFLYIGTRKNYLNIGREIMKNSSQIIQWMMVIYILLLIYSVVFGNGVQIGWGTIILYGPFRLSHILAYELIVLELLGLNMYKLTEKKRWIVLSAIFEIFVLLTSVRSALLASVVILLVFFRGFKMKRQIYLLLVAIILGIGLAYFGVYNQVIEKSMYALNNGSITNGREWLIESSMTIFSNSSFIEKIFGLGYFQLLEENRVIIGNAIQGHNDIFNVLICFGVVGLGMYLYYISNYIKGNGYLGCFLFLFILLYFNGLFLYIPVVIALPIIRLFFLLYNEEKI